MFFKVDSSHPNFKEISYLNVVYILSALSLGFYIWRYNIFYNISQFNIMLLPLYILLLLSPLFFFKHRNKQFYAFNVIIPGYLISFILIYLSGGLTAPGIYWLGTLPIVCGFLFGRIGLASGVAILVFLLSVLGCANYFDFGLNFIESVKQDNTERVINTLLFFVFITVSTSYFLLLEERYIKQFKERKSDSDSLLKVLMHDIATPLTILQFESIKLRTFENKELQPDLIERISKTVENMTSILSQLRDIRALKGNGHFADLVLLDLRAVVREVVNSMAEGVSQQRISFNLNTSDKKVMVVGDEGGIRDIVVHTIIKNAVLSSPEDSWIDVLLAENVQNSVNGFLFEVRDYGDPFSDDQIKAIFSLENKVTKLSRIGDLTYAFPLMKGYLEKLGATVTVHSFLGLNGKSGNSIKVFFPSVEV